MNKNFTAIAVLAAAVGTGYGLYTLGVRQGKSNSPHSMEVSQPKAEAPKADPSTWGISEGEAATRRHMTTGIKAGDVDPVTGRSVLYYHDPMVPGKKFEAPAKSPFMDMMLVPAYSGSEGADNGTVVVSSRIQQNLGIRTSQVLEGSLESEILAPGSITWNERGQFSVQARAAGFVERLHIRATMDPVVQGQPLFELYVPEWVAAQEDFLSVQRMQGHNLASLVDSARQRMRQVGMNDAQIASVERSSQVQPRTTVAAPASGVMTELLVREGSTVMPGTLLARINSLSTVWAQAEVPESQVAGLRPGDPVTATTTALPGEKFVGKVQTLLPEVSASTRTRKVRMELKNSKGHLVPGMFVQMRMGRQDGKTTLLVPSEAVVRTGKRTLVMTVESNGAFRPIEVQLGTEQGGQSEILSGLVSGQKIVSSGQFLIDSESSLKAVETRLAEEPPKPESESGSGAAETYKTGALVEAVEGDMLTVSHPAIPGLKWPAMTMDFKLAPGASSGHPTAGSQIEMEFRLQEGEAPQIVNWQLDKKQVSGGAK